MFGRASNGTGRAAVPVRRVATLAERYERGRGPAYGIAGELLHQPSDAAVALPEREG